MVRSPDVFSSSILCCGGVLYRRYTDRLINLLTIQDGVDHLRINDYFLSNSS